MDKTNYKAMFEQIKKNKKALGLTFLILLFLGLLLFLIRSCETEGTLVENSVKTEDVKLGDEMEKLIFRIQNCSRLYTTEYKIHKIITHEDQKVLKMGGFKIGIPLTDRHIAIPMDATLKAYVDLGTFSEKSIKTDGEHILIKNCQHASVAGSITLSAEACIHICGIADRDHAGIELLLVAFLLAEKRSVLVVNVADEFESAVGRIAYCN